MQGFGDGSRGATAGSGWEQSAVGLVFFVDPQLGKLQIAIISTVLGSSGHGQASGHTDNPGEIAGVPLVPWDSVFHLQSSRFMQL